MLKVYQTQFLATAMAVDALKFGEFTLKSGRKSPYFFNAGAFSSGKALAVLADAYAAEIHGLIEAGHAFDGLFGPAYKGIPIVAAIATTLYDKYQIDLPWTFNRKEAKDHGEGGMLVGSPVKGKNILIVDDVLTAGTAVRQSMALLKAEGANPMGIVVALDREEKLDGAKTSALQQLQAETGVLTRAVVGYNDLLSFVENTPEVRKHHQEMLAYREKYGV